MVFIPFSFCLVPCTNAVTNACFEETTQLESYLVGCNFDFHSALFSNGVCPGKDVCSCEVSIFDSSVCADASHKMYDSNVPASFKFEGIPLSAPTNDVPRVPADGVFIYSLTYTSLDESIRAALLSDEWQHSAEQALRVYLSMEDAVVGVKSREEVDNTMVVVLSITVPQTSTLLDLINVNNLLNQAEAGDSFSGGSYGHRLDGSRMVEAESGLEVVRNAMAKSKNDASEPTKSVAFYAVLGGLAGCIVGAAAVYALRKRTPDVAPTLLESKLNASAITVHIPQVHRVNPMHRNRRISHSRPKPRGTSRL